MTASSNSVADKAARLATWVEETERLCNEATPGPWWFDGQQVNQDIQDGLPELRVYLTGTDRYHCLDAPTIIEPCSENFGPDGKFIAAARPLVPALVRICRGLLARWEQAETADTEAARKGHNGTRLEYRFTLPVLRTELSEAYAAIFGTEVDGDGK